MTSIYDIPRKDIEIFLLDNNQNIESNDEDYKLVFALLKDKKAIRHTISIVEWMIAHNLLIKKINVKNYTSDEIDNMSQNEINKLAKLLTMKGNDRTNVKNILRFMNKLDKEFLINDINDVILENLNKIELQNLNIYSLNFDDIIRLLKTYRNKKAIRLFIYDNLEKIVAYHRIKIKTEDPYSTEYVLDNILDTSNVYEKDIMIKVIKDNRITFIEYHSDEEINFYIKEIEKINSVEEIRLEEYPEINSLVNFILNLITADEIGLAKQTFNIIHKFKYSGRNYSFNHELINNLINQNYIDHLKVIINFVTDEEFIIIINEIIREQSLEHIRPLLENLVRLRRYDILINIIELYAEKLLYNYEGTASMKITNLLEKMKDAIKSENYDLIFNFIKSIIKISSTDY